MARRTTKLSIQDIAEMAQVSTATVSRVVNGYPHITPEKRDRVLKIVERLQYKPSSIARELRLSETRRIMVTAADLSSPVLDELIRGIDGRAGEGQYNVFVAPTSKGNDREVEMIGQVVKGVFDGAILFGTTLAPADLERMAMRFNIVQCGEFIPARIAGCSIDDEAAARDMVTYLLSKGHRAIAILRSSKRFSGLARERGYRSAFASANVAIDENLVVECEYTYEAGDTIGSSVITGRPGVTALFCTNDRIALGCMNAARRVGRAVPEQLAIVGFDGTVESTMCEPQITTVRQPYYEIGYLSMDTLIDSVESGLRPYGHRFLPHTLTIRGSA
jgi:LacI family repressor for deo operon, udp, cdd, tsx, nupC, and nupG